jgi:hypothetical protein
MQTMQQKSKIVPGQVDNSVAEHQTTTGRVLSKERVLDYEFPDLVDRIQKEMGLSVDNAHALFKDMLAFLYICGTHQSKRDPFYPPLNIDEAWHVFLLFTREYDAFCRYHFGAFIHHSPVTPTNRARHKDTPKNLVFPIAREIFGELSDNWKIEAADCPQSCCPSYDDPHG